MGLKPRPDCGVIDRISLTILSSSASVKLEKLCSCPKGMPNSCRRQFIVLIDTPNILAISAHRKPSLFLRTPICSCVICMKGLPT